MLYKILRPITRMVLQGYYRKIYVDGQKNIPSGRPIILAVNHPAAFTEPCVLATHLERELYFLIRGGVVNKWIKWFFDGTNQIPVYRFRDGFSHMRQNEKQFDFCYDVLRDNGCLVIFAEGSTEDVKHVRPLQKGAARIAFGAMEKRKLEEVMIVPVGVNFEYSARSRTGVIVEIEKPISCKKYFDLFRENEREGLTAITDRIYKGLSAGMVHIERRERLDFADDILIYRNNELPEKNLPVAEYDQQRKFAELKRVSDRINEMTSDEWDSLKNLNTEYRNRLTEKGLSDGAVAGKKPDMRWLLGGGLPAVPGWLFLYPIVFLTYYIQGKINRTREYVTSFRLAGFLIFTPLMLLLWTVAGYIFLGPPALLLLLLLPALGLTAVLWLDQWRSWREMKKWERLTEEERNLILEQRERILRFFR